MRAPSTRLCGECCSDFPWNAVTLPRTGRAPGSLRASLIASGGMLLEANGPRTHTLSLHRASVALKP
eukprot:5822130-Lingulodinium_polyedra.AAC.1